MSAHRVLSRTIAAGGARLLRSRTLMRAPIWIYRARLGFLFGSRVLMLEHIGRKTGLPRQVVLEVIDHPRPDTYVVPSGFGDRAQWFRNVQANPRVRVYASGRAPALASARVLGQQEADHALAAYQRKHPRAWGTFQAGGRRDAGESHQRHEHGAADGRATTRRSATMTQQHPACIWPEQGAERSATLSGAQPFPRILQLIDSEAPDFTRDEQARQFHAPFLPARGTDDGHLLDSVADVHARVGPGATEVPTVGQPQGRRHRAERERG
jgi:deazaflavin-dependent oxidoreductase (nitroreductase family)